MSGLGNIAGALSGLAQGFVQGRQLRDQERMQGAELQALQQNLQEGKVEDSAKQLDIYRTLAQADPSLAQNPNFLQAVNQAGSGIGVNYGSQLPSTFTQTPFNDLLSKSPQILEYLQGLPPEQRGQILDKFSGVPDAVKTAPAMITNPLQQARFPGLVEQQMSLVTQGKLDPNGLISWVKTFAPRYGYQPDEILQEYTPQIGEMAKARIGKDIAEMGLTGKKAAMYDDLTMSQIKRNLSSTAVNEARAAAIPQQVAAEVTKAQAAAQSAANGAANVQMKLNAITQMGGVDPRVFSAVNGAMGEASKQVNSLRIARDNLNNQIIKLMTSLNYSDGDPKNAAFQKVQELKKQSAQLTSQLGQSEKTLASFEQNHQQLLTRAYNAMGAPSSWQAGKAVTQVWMAPNSGKPVRMTSMDGGLTFTDGKGNWYDANKSPIAGPNP